MNTAAYSNRTYSRIQDNPLVPTDLHWALGGCPVPSVQPVRQSLAKQRVLPAFVAFIVAAGAVYSTAWVALGLLRHIVMPIVAVVIAGYLAMRVFRFTGRDSSRQLPR